MTILHHRRRGNPAHPRLRAVAICLLAIAAALCAARLLDSAVTRANHAALHPCTAEGC